MSRYITIRLTLAQAEAACNATDLIADEHRADGRKRGALLYQRASDIIGAAINKQAPEVDDEGA